MVINSNLIKDIDYHPTFCNLQAKNASYFWTKIGISGYCVGFECAPSLIFPSPEALYYIEQSFSALCLCVCVSIVEKIAGYGNMGNEGEMLASIACSPFDLICLLEKHFINEVI